MGEGVVAVVSGGDRVVFVMGGGAAVPCALVPMPSPALCITS